MDVVILIIAVAVGLLIADRIIGSEREAEVSEDELRRVLIASLKRELELAEYGAPEGADHLK